MSIPMHIFQYVFYSCILFVKFSCVNCNRREEKREFMLKDLIISNRSTRRFDCNFIVKEETLYDLVDLARLSASAGNLQPLKFFLSFSDPVNKKIFPCLRWARALKSWTGPSTDEQPSAYIIILGDKRIAKHFSLDTGIAAQSILLGAVEQGMGGCMIASCNRKSLMKVLNINVDLEIQLVIAIGKPSETIVIAPLGEDGSTNYFRDKHGVHHVPKRSLDSIIVP